VACSYDVRGYLCRVTVFDEERLMGEHDDSRASRGSAGATRLPEAAGVAGLLGQWRGDATIRWSKGALSVAKQDLTLKRDGDVFFRSLSIADMRGDHVDELRKFGVTRPSEAAAEDLVDVVAFEDGAALVHFSGAAAYALAPLRVQDGVAFHVEAGMLVEEAADESDLTHLAAASHRCLEAPHRVDNGSSCSCRLDHR